VADCVADLNGHQVVWVVGDRGRVIKWVEKPAREEEMPARLLQFYPRVACLGRVVNTPRGDPPPAVAVEVGIPALVVERVRHVGNKILSRVVAAVDLGEQAWREGELVPLTRYFDGSAATERQDPVEPVGAVIA